MNELKLTELAPYLPYGVECIVDPNYAQIRTKIWRLDAQEGDANIFSFFSKGGYYYRTLKSVKPILLPLSDLNNEIEYNGERFVPMDRLSKEFDMNVVEHCMISENLSNTKFLQRVCSWAVFQKIISWHFDVSNLLGRNLAVDYNTVNQNV